MIWPSQSNLMTNYNLSCKKLWEIYVISINPTNFQFDTGSRVGLSSWEVVWVRILNLQLRKMWLNYLVPWFSYRFKISTFQFKEWYGHWNSVAYVSPGLKNSPQYWSFGKWNFLWGEIMRKIHKKLDYFWKIRHSLDIVLTTSLTYQINCFCTVLGCIITPCLTPEPLLG